MTERVLVTGISGYVGGHVALELLKTGYAVRGSVRDLRRADTVRAALGAAGADTSGVEFVVLDLLSDEGWRGAMDGVRFVHHVASPFVTQMPADKMDLIRPAIEGTRRALEAAFASGVERVVLTSSMAAVMYGHARDRTAPFEESDWTNLEGRDVNAYVESKTRAEREAWAIAVRLGRTQDLVAVNPSAIFGPLLDSDPGTSVALVQQLINGGVPAAPRISLSMIDVRDVAAVHLAAMTVPEAGGRRFLTAGPSLSFLEMANVVRHDFPDLAGKLPRFEVPDWLVRLVAVFYSELRGNLGELGVIKRTEALDAKTLLGRGFIAPEETIRATVESLIARGLIAKRG